MTHVNNIPYTLSTCPQSKWWPLLDHSRFNVCPIHTVDCVVVRFILDNGFVYLTTVCVSYVSRIVFCAPYGLRGCKNKPAPFTGRISYNATKPGLVLFCILACFNCIVAYLDPFLLRDALCIARRRGWHGWVAVRHTPVLYQNGQTYLKTFSTI